MYKSLIGFALLVLVALLIVGCGSSRNRYEEPAIHSVATERAAPLKALEAQAAANQTAEAEQAGMWATSQAYDEGEDEAVDALATLAGCAATDSCGK